MIDSIISKLQSYISIVGNSLSIMMFGRDGATNVITTNINEKKRWNQDDMLIESLRLTNTMTALFSNTKVQVFVYKSDKPNAFTFPGEPVLGPYKQTMWIAGVTAARLNPLILVIFLVLMNVEKLKNALLHGAFLIHFNESTKKIDISTRNVTCYVASSLIDMMAEDELKAVLLHEVGHNTMIMLSVLDFVTNVLWTMSIGTFLYSMFNGEFQREIRDNTNMRINELSFALGITATVSFILSIFLRRRQEVKSDEFAIKCGYGNALSRAIKKLNNTIYGDKSSLPKPGIFQGILRFIDKIYTLIHKGLSTIGMTSYPERDQREAMIDKKSASYTTPTNGSVWI
mgnify:CR=1 FL=1